MNVNKISTTLAILICPAIIMSNVLFWYIIFAFAKCGWDITLWNHVDSVIFYIMWSFTSIVSLLECATVVKESEELKEDKDEKRILHYYST